REYRVAAALWNVAQSYHRQYSLDHDLQSLYRARDAYRRFRDVAGHQRFEMDTPSDEERADAAVAEIDRELTLRAASYRPEVYERRRSTGKALFIIGVVNVVIAVAGLGVFLATLNDRTDDLGFGVLAGIVPGATAGGVALILHAIGVPLWATAQRRLNRH